MNKKNWIPTKEDELVDLQEKWQEDLPKASLQTAYGWNATECSETAVKIGRFLTARKAYKDVNSTSNRLDKDEKKAKSIEAMQDFANSSIRFNKRMTDAQKLRYGIRVPDDTKTSHGVPAHQQKTFSRSFTPPAAAGSISASMALAVSCASCMRPFLPSAVTPVLRTTPYFFSFGVPVAGIPHDSAVLQRLFASEYGACFAS